MAAEVATLLTEVCTSTLTTKFACFGCMALQSVYHLVHTVMLFLFMLCPVLISGTILKRQNSHKNLLYS